MSTSHTETLRDIARLASDRHDGGGGRAMSRVAKAGGHSLAYTTFDKLLAGTYTSRPAEKTLRALAYLAGIPEARVYDAAGRDYPSSRFADMLPPEIDSLNRDQRQAVIDVASAFLRTNKAWEELSNVGWNEGRRSKQGTGRTAHLHKVDAGAGPGQKSEPAWDAMAANRDAGITAEQEHAAREAAERGEEPQDR